jgi:hypothetical protein
MDTLMYWISRLEPIIRRDNNEEIIVVFANRSGSEDDFCYAGTSTVLGIYQGEVRVYGILGRGDKELLVVDTDKEPYGRLLYRPESSSGRGAASWTGLDGANRETDWTAVPPPPPPPPPVLKARKNSRSGFGNGDGDRTEPRAGKARRSTTPSRGAAQNPSQPRSSRPSSRSQRAGNQPKLSLQTAPEMLENSGKMKNGQIITPTAPSPTPIGIRPRFSVPPTELMTQKYIDSQGVPPQSTLTPHPMTLPPSAVPQSAKIYGGEIAFLYHGLPPVPDPSNHPRRLKDQRVSYYSDDSAPSSQTARDSLIVSMYRKGYSLTGSNAAPKGSTPAPRRSDAEWDPPRASPTPVGDSSTAHRPGSRKGEYRRPSAPTSAIDPPPDFPGTPHRDQREMVAIEKKLEEIALRAQANSVPASRNSSRPGGAFDTTTLSKTSEPLRGPRIAAMLEESVSLGMPSPPTTRLSNSSFGMPSQGSPGFDPNRPPSRGRPLQAHQQDVYQAPQQPPKTESRTSKPRSRQGSAPPMDLTQFQVILEFPSANCPLHGSRHSSQPRSGQQADIDQDRRSGGRSSSNSRLGMDPVLDMSINAAINERREAVNRTQSPTARCSALGTPPPWQRQAIRKTTMTNTAHPTKEQEPASMPRRNSRSATSDNRYRPGPDSSDGRSPAVSPLVPRRRRSDELFEHRSTKDDNLSWVEMWMPPVETLTSLHFKTINSASTLASASSGHQPETPEPTPTTPRAMLIMYDSTDTDTMSLSLAGKTLACVETTPQSVTAA